ncbi:metallophosphoesterase family protein [Chromatium okenii]|uniref:DNA repair exonuclease n=1 Tax=Chromatium okenii TaxID=61644 RepID=A0A2S7XUQ7_9GAMM|nr:DNA repair exonuclease [Chromatium okenii]PQJ97218.1 DNA repair exonuclease [Chromatium okenii]
MKLIHAADVHLDSPLRGLERYDGAPLEELRGATRRAFENLIALALTEAVDVVLLAGDLYDGDWKDYRTGLFFATQMARLHEAGIIVFIIAGNHDAASQITRILRLPPNVHIFSTQRPETRIVEAHGLAVHGQGFATRAVTDDLTRNYPLAQSGLFNIGLLHTSLDGRPGHETYAPCSLNGLRSRGYDYWALGHVHRREILTQDPWIVFPGNLQGRHARETGAKGAMLVQVTDGTVDSVTFHPLDVVRWAQCPIDLTDATTFEELDQRLESGLRSALNHADGRLLAVRVQFTGRSELHPQLQTRQQQLINNARVLASSIHSSDLWLERLVLDTTSTAPPPALGRNDALGGLVQAIRDLELDQERLAELAKEVTELSDSLPAELRSGDDAFDPIQPQVLHACLEDVKALLFERLLEQDRDCGVDD